MFYEKTYFAKKVGQFSDREQQLKFKNFKSLDTQQIRL